MNIVEIIGALVKAGYGPWLVVAVVAIIVFVKQLPEIIKAGSACVAEHRKINHRRQDQLKKLSNGLHQRQRKQLDPPPKRSTTRGSERR